MSVEMAILFALVKKVHGKLLMRNDDIDKDIMEKQGQISSFY